MASQNSLPLQKAPSSQDVVATYNYWDLPCSPKQFFQITGGGKLKRRPWAAGNLLRAFEDCTQSRQYNKWFENDKLKEDGTHIKGKLLAGEGATEGASTAVAPEGDAAAAPDEGGATDAVARSDEDG